MESPFDLSHQIDTVKNDKENKIHVSKHEDIILTFPRTNGWRHQSFWCYEKFLRGILSVQQNFQANSGEIILASAQKTGTTWLKALTYAIVTRKKYDDTTSPLLAKPPHACIPSLEIDLVQEKENNRDPEIPLISTHIPYTSLPNSIIQRGCKIVYIWRDARDTFVSLWLFLDKVLKFRGVEIIPLEEAFELFCQELSSYGPYWDHVLGYHKVRLENPDRILFLKYEEMMKDTAFYVKILAKFIGFPFSKEEEDNGVLEKIIKLCCFDKLSNLEVNKSGKHREDSPNLVRENKLFFRKGKVGDWSSYLTTEMGERLDLIMKNKLKGSGMVD